MRAIKSVVTAAVVSGTLLASLAGTSAAQAKPAIPAATACPSGAFCIRETNGSILSKNIFYSYGAHNLSDVTGKRVLVNSQTGGAGFQLCFNSGGSSCSKVDRATGSFAPYNMTPINSIVLVK